MQNKEIVLTFNGEGSCEALHMDEFPLTFLGPMRFERASTIEFDEAAQSFFVKVTGASEVAQRMAENFSAPEVPECASGFAGYDTARAFEVDWLQACKLLGVDPLSPEGIGRGFALRETVQYDAGVPQH